MVPEPVSPEPVSPERLFPSREPRPATSPWDRDEAPGLFSAEQAARRLGHYRWVERFAFETMGAWAGTVDELDVKLKLVSQCYRHAWHADLWWDCMLQLGDLAPETLTVPANGAVVALLEAIAGASGTIERLVGLYRVLVPRKIAAYTYHLNRASAVSDAPAMRALRLVLGDEVEDWREGEMLVQSLLGDADEVRRATGHLARLELLASASGGIAGAGTLGGVATGGA